MLLACPYAERFAKTLLMALDFYFKCSSGPQIVCSSPADGLFSKVCQIISTSGIFLQAPIVILLKSCC